MKIKGSAVALILGMLLLMVVGMGIGLLMADILVRYDYVGLVYVAVVLGANFAFVRYWKSE